MIVDSHQHFWALSRGDYPWPDETVAPIFRDFGPKDLAPLLSSTGVEKTVLVQATDTVAETKFLLSLAEETDFVAGVVGWVDMADENASDVLVGLAQFPLLKGIRPMLQGIERTDWILDPACTPTLETMIRLGLRFDALVQPRHLPILDELVKRHPDLPIVIDHAAKPAIKADTPPDSEWLEGMAKLAEHKHVHCKLSGLVTEGQAGWQMEDVIAHCLALIDLFGPDRLMWGSDWPVVNLASSYEVWNDTIAKVATEIGAEGRAAIMGGTAIRFYDL